MSFATRVDNMVRTAGEKAQLADEFLTRSQIIPGTNIYFDYLANYDIRINALTGGVTSTGLRQLFGYIQLTEMRVTDGVGARKPFHGGLGDTVSSPSVAADYKYFGTAAFADIVHNWNLEHRNAFSVSIHDVRAASITNYWDSVVSEPFVVGVDSNRIRIWGTNPVAGKRITPADWADQVDTKFNTNAIDGDFHFDSTQNTGVLGANYRPMYVVRITEVVI